jgi:Na+/H+-dicarboxylate symporter
VVGWILATAPIGVFALTLTLAAQTGVAVIGAVAGFLVVVALLLVVAALATYPLVRVFGGIPVRIFARACVPAQAVAFSTRSSLASLPPMLEEAEATLKLPPQVSGLVLPASVSVFKYASPISRIAGTFFIASLFGVELGGLEIAAIAAALGAFSFYSPGIPSGGLFIMAPLYQAFGLPLEGIGILIALDLLPDMILTVANVTGDMAVAAIIGGKERAVE